jgi:dsRNA-specific ribonuclease
MTKTKIALVKNDAIGKFALDVGLADWLCLSKKAEEKKHRENLKVLGCLFEAFVGALFLDFNQVELKDKEETGLGPGFQTAETFIKNVFETHVDWAAMLNTDDNYKNILQVRMQREFKVTPEYVELGHSKNGYEMGVFLCLGQPMWKRDPETAAPLSSFGGSLAAVKKHTRENPDTFIFLGKGVHKIKKKAEQIACEYALRKFK